MTIMPRTTPATSYLNTTTPHSAHGVFLGLSVGAVVGIAVGAFVGLVIIVILIIVCVICWRRRRAVADDDEDELLAGTDVPDYDATKPVEKRRDPTKPMITRNLGENQGLGTLRFSVRFVEASLVLRVKVIAAAGMRSTHGAGVCNSRIRLSMLPNVRSVSLLTQIKKKTSRPEWKESFIIYGVSNEMLRKLNILFELIECPKGLPPVQVAQIVFPLRYVYVKPDEDNNQNFYFLSVSQIDLRRDDGDDQDAEAGEEGEADDSRSLMGTVVSNKTGYTINQVDKYLKNDESPSFLEHANRKRSYSIPGLVSNVLTPSEEYRRRFFSAPGSKVGERENPDDDVFSFIKEDNKTRVRQLPRSIDCWRFFQPHSNTKNFGELLVALKYDSGRHILDVTVVKGRGIVALRDDVSVYVQMSIIAMSEKHHKHFGHYKTSKRKRTETPSWNETNTFILPIKISMKQCVVVLDLMGRSTGGLKKLLGAIRIGWNAFPAPRKHWREVLANPTKTIPMWHACQTLNKDV